MPTCEPLCVAESMQPPAAVVSDNVEEGSAHEEAVNERDRTTRNVPADASGISNSGVKRKKAKVKDSMVDAIDGLTSSLVDVKACKEERSTRIDQREEVRDERAVARQMWRQEAEDRRISSAEKRNENLCSVLGVMTRAISGNLWA
ncbi:hypothetical protein R1sor_000214 [Riccia sorocarpa]|uniref:Uncharacterized protein n=1 Tax=Riccia sorocarpa TaxID=122646 RepID=A0ABD3GVI7_9MARC